MEERYLYFALWSLLWIITLNIPPGSTQIATSYRLNFLHGLLSSIAAILCLLGYISEAMTTVSTLSYFLVDFINIFLNDFVWKVSSYHNPVNRRIEYFHHMFCFAVGIMSEYVYRDFCTFTYNPFVKLMFAEFSTPFLIAWRMTKSDVLGGLFVLSFFACRIVYHGYYFIPECMTRCQTPADVFGYLYNGMNLFFFVTIIMKLAGVGGDKFKSKSEKGKPSSD
jgi:hypothetical protein